jgi:hypothetical protein
MSDVAIVIAVDAVRPDFSQVVRSDGLVARHAQGSRARRPPIHQNESHVAPPDAKQNTVSDGSERSGGGAQRSVTSTKQRRLPKRNLYKRFTVPVPRSGRPDFGKVPQELHCNRCQAT